MRNEMMHRPIVQENVLNFLRTGQKQLSGELGQIQKEAKENGVPVIPHETVVFLQFLLGQLQPRKILEIGTAIGFSSSLMAQIIGTEGQITTIDRYDVMIRKAKETYRRLDLENQITLLEGQASDLFPTLTGPYDFIFMDSAKSKYIEFLPECLRLLKKGGVLMVDDIFQAGTVFEPIESIPRNQKTIHRKLKLFLEVITSHPDLTTSLIPLGDGIALITKEADDVQIEFD